jgi:hypothetical protein
MVLCCCKYNDPYKNSKGIKDIVDFYGGRCEYGIKKTVSLGSKNTSTFWLKLSQSSTLDSLIDIAELPTSNIAYLFYNSLGKEQSKYDKIEATIIFSNDKSLTYTYSTEVLEIVKKKFPIAEQIVALIKEKKFEEVTNYIVIDSVNFTYDKKLLLSSFNKFETEFGTIKEVKPAGFKFYTTKNGKNLLHLAGLVIRNKENTQFSITIDPKSAKEEIFYLNYKY